VGLVTGYRSYAYQNISYQLYMAQEGVYFTVKKGVMWSVWVREDDFWKMADGVFGLGPRYTSTEMADAFVDSEWSLS